MKVFIAEYHWSYRGGYDDRWKLVVAETKSAALGLILEAEPQTQALEWELTEIDTSTADVHHVTSHCS